jgi:hypothetical protein
MINNGTGAGGANTNATGLEFEDVASLEQYYSIIQPNNIGTLIKFNQSDKTFLHLKKGELSRWTLTLGNEYNDIPKLHGTKQPDDCFINLHDKIIIIIEKKFQQGGGSVVEKLQTPVNKIRNLKRRYPTYKIHYIYWLSKWFQRNAQAELLDLTEDSIPYFIGISENIKIQVISQIINCK